MSKYEVLQLCEAYKDEWNDCVLNSKLGYVYDFYQMLVKCEYEQSTNLTFAIKDVKENTIVLIMPLYNRSSILINDQAGTKSFYCRYGPVIRNGLSKKETIEIKEIFLKNLKRLLKAYNHAHMDSLITMLLIHLFSGDSNREFDIRGLLIYVMMNTHYLKI